MTDEIFEKMKKGVYYPGNHLGKKQELEDLVEKGHLHRMDGSFLCGPDSEPNYRLTDKGLLHKRQKKSWEMSGFRCQGTEDGRQKTEGRWKKLGGWAGEMKFIRDPAERTTAATDIILALIAFGGIVFLQYLLRL